ALQPSLAHQHRQRHHAHPPQAPEARLMATTITAAQSAATAASAENFQRYYEEAGPDYAAWSPHFNMHFGFYRRGMNPFHREAMLEQMNREVLRRLQLTDAAPAHILDMGCGLGATLRSLAHRL